MGKTRAEHGYRAKEAQTLLSKKDKISQSKTARKDFKSTQVITFFAGFS
jgi:hypothetical protein